MAKTRILIVEDEAVIAMEAEIQLQSLGYEVTSVVDTGEKAIEKAELDKPDLVLMDIRIKGEMDGIRTAEAIRNRFEIPVIFSTAYLDEEKIDRAKITMPFGYVLKPMQERDLKVTVEMALYVAEIDNERKRVENLLRIQRDLGIALGKSLDFHEVLRLCLRAALDASEMESGGIYIVDSNTKSLELAYHEGLSEQFVSTVSRFEADSPHAQMIFAGVPIYTAHKEIGLNLEEAEHKENLRAIAIIPVKHDEQVVGCLNVASHTDPEVPQFARHTLETIVTQIGDAIVKKQVEEKLAKKTLYLDNILNNASDSAIATTDIDFRISYFNPLAETFFGYRADEVIGKTVQEMHLMENVSPERLEKAVDQVRVTGEYCYEIAQKTDSGIRFLKSRVSSIVDAEKKLVGYALFSHDVTARKQTEEALKESEEKYRETFETMVLGVVYQNADGSITDANPAAERILGLSLDQMQGRTSIDPRWKAIHQDGSDFPGDTHPAMVALQTGKSVQNIIMGVFHPQQNEHLWININAVPKFRIGETKPYEVFTTFNDITELKIGKK